MFKNEKFFVLMTEKNVFFSIPFFLCEGAKGKSGEGEGEAFKPPCGLENLGNTCYMNATMQCLFSIKELKEALKKYSTTSTLDSSANLTSAARDLFQRMEMQPGSSQMQTGE